MTNTEQPKEIYKGHNGWILFTLFILFQFAGITIYFAIYSNNKIVRDILQFILAVANFKFLGLILFILIKSKDTKLKETIIHVVLLFLTYGLGNLVYLDIKAASGKKEISRVILIHLGLFFFTYGIGNLIYFIVNRTSK